MTHEQFDIGSQQCIEWQTLMSCEYALVKLNLDDHYVINFIKDVLAADGFTGYFSYRHQVSPSYGAQFGIGCVDWSLNF